MEIIKCKARVLSTAGHGSVQMLDGPDEGRCWGLYDGHDYPDPGDVIAVRYNRDDQFCTRDRFAEDVDFLRVLVARVGFDATVDMLRKAGA